MDIEQLNKTQIILLGLLLSFITAIATGIVVVRLMDQAPGSVVQTVNRVVERTVERVVPSTADGKNDEITVVQEKTTIVRDVNAVQEAISSNQHTLLKIFASSSSLTTSTKGEEKLVALGYFLNNQTLVAYSSSFAKDEDYKITSQDGTKVFKGKVLSTDLTTGVTFIVVQDIVDKDFINPRITPPSLGETVILRGGLVRERIEPGVVVSLTDTKIGTTTSVITDKIYTNIAGSQDLLGFPAISLDGRFVGIVTDVEGRVEITPTDMLNRLIPSSMSNSVDKSLLKTR